MGRRRLLVLQDAVVAPLLPAELGHQLKEAKSKRGRGSRPRKPEAREAVLIGRQATAEQLAQRFLVRGQVGREVGHVDHLRQFKAWRQHVQEALLRVDPVEPATADAQLEFDERLAKQVAGGQATAQGIPVALTRS